MIFTTKDLAAAYGVTMRRAEQWCRAGRVPGAEKKGRDWVIVAERAEDLRVEKLEARPVPMGERRGKPPK